jgi:hypothetical protein
VSVICHDVMVGLSRIIGAVLIVDIERSNSGDVPAPLRGNMMRDYAKSLTG